MSLVTTAPRHTHGLEASARIIVNETDKGLRVVWTYRATLASSAFTMLVTYLAFQYFIGGGALVDELLALTAPGLFAYAVAFITTLRVVAGLLEDRNTGTFEQIHLARCPLGSWL